MNDYNVAAVVPLDNDMPTVLAPAGSNQTEVFLQDGSQLTIQDIVDDPSTYDGCFVEDKAGTPVTSNSSQIVVANDHVYLVNKDKNFHLTPKFDLGRLDLVKRADELAKRIGEISHVTAAKTIVKTELTVVYGPSGSAKTATMIFDVVKNIASGVIRGEDVIYVNLDDSATGLAEKAKLLEATGVQMIREFDMDLIHTMTHRGLAKNKIVIIDTVKKIVDPQDKRAVAQMMKILKNFTHAGGSVVLIAHSNKHLGVDGSPVLEGVGDLKNDADCVVQVTRNKDVITLKNEKERSYVERLAIFKTAETKSYKELLNSFRQLSGEEAEKLYDQRRKEVFIEENERLVDSIKSEIGPASAQKTDLVRRVVDDTGLNRKAVIDVLDLLEGELWKVTKGSNGSKNYELINQPMVDVAQQVELANEEEPLPDYV